MLNFVFAVFSSPKVTQSNYGNQIQHGRVHHGSALISRAKFKSL